MAAFNEWWDSVEIATYAFTTKGVAHLAWDAAIKSVEGVPKPDKQQLKAEIAACADDLNTLSRCSCDEAYCIRVINKLRQLSAV